MKELTEEYHFQVVLVAGRQEDAATSSLTNQNRNKTLTLTVLHSMLLNKLISSNHLTRPVNQTADNRVSE